MAAAKARTQKKKSAAAASKADKKVEKVQETVIVEPVVEEAVVEEQPEEEQQEEEIEEEEIIPEAIPLEDLNESDIDDEDGDIITEQRITVNNTEAMTRITEDFKLKNLPWIETMTLTSSEPIVLADVHDDMARELAFYQQALEAAKIARDRFKEADVPFSRPDDYFAEMLKSDEHMAKVRQRLLDEDAKLKASEDAKRQRELKKFGKKVQVEKQLERQKQKADMLEKIKLLKRKRKDGAGSDLTLDNDFDIELENADTRKRAKTDKKPVNYKRQHKDTKYGFGGKKRHAKSNTAESSAELGGYNKMKGKVPKGKSAKRPGKAKRQTMRNKK